jgi:toxin ParE1/3/4
VVKLHIRQAAIDDLDEIWDYTESQFSSSQADKYYFQIKSVCHSLLSNPNIGKSYTHLGESIKGIVSGRHLIFYKIHEDKIDILRIVHGNRNYSGKDLK